MSEKKETTNDFLKEMAQQDNPLLYIQSELKAPKNQYNSFGNYNYRNCEDILEALKPLMLKTGTTLTCDDTIVLIGDRHYLRATVTLQTRKQVLGQVSAYAREEETQKGMNAAQITGACSSYARKYALNGLFCIDDTRDADSAKPSEKTEQTPDQQQPADKKKPANFQKCPDCGVVAVMESKFEDGWWFCFEKKKGCGKKFPPDHPAFVRDDPFEQMILNKQMEDNQRMLLDQYLSEMAKDYAGGSIETVKLQGLKRPDSFWDGFKNWLERTEKERAPNADVPY
jgi:hypothetical protein